MHARGHSTPQGIFVLLLTTFKLLVHFLIITKTWSKIDVSEGTSCFSLGFV